MTANNTYATGDYRARKKHCSFSFVKYITYSLFSSLLLFTPIKLTAQTDSRNLEYKVKAAYLYNFTKLIIWPNKAFTSVQKTTFNICILERNPFGHALELLRNTLVNGLDLITEISEPQGELEHCQIVYFPKNMQEDYISILLRLKEKNILTVSDIIGFVHKGGHIGLDIVNDKVRFNINLGAIKSSDLKISAKLLDHALTVVEQ